MFSRQKPQMKPKSQPKSGRNLSQYGLFDIPDFNNDGMDNMEDDDDDADLEAELLALTGESKVTRKPKATVTLPTPNLDLMVAASLKDISSDESLSGDDDDPDLLDELSAITGEEDSAQPTAGPTTAPPKIGSQEQLLRERLAMYQQAEANAQEAGETSRARRFARGIKTLQDLLKQAGRGEPISEDSIPPEVSVKKTEPRPPAPDVTHHVSEETPTPIRQAPPPPIPPRGASMGVALPGLTRDTPPPTQNTADSPVTLLPSSPRSMAAADCQAPDAAIQPATLLPSSPRSMASADCQAPIATSDDHKDKLQLLINRRDEYKRAALIAKKAGDMSTAITHIKVAKQFDTVIAGLESGQTVDLTAMPPPPTHLVVNSEIQQSSVAQPEPLQPEPADVQEFSVEQPRTVMEALEQRLSKYKSQEDAAKAEGNTSKARRMGRIVKQYQDAIKLHKVGKQIPVDELPTPPGYPPIPVEGVSKPPPTPSPVPPRTQPLPTVPSPTEPTSQPSTSSDTSQDKLNVRKIGGSHQERQLLHLLEKQKQFKIAALQAKQKGEVNQAKEYLRLAKGFDKLIEASNCGLPVDMNTVPVPPSSKVALETDFDIISAADCTPVPSDGVCVLEKLEKDLIEQMKKSVETRNHFKAMGDIASANRFEQQALHSKKDLDLVRVARKHNHPVPRFHYETRSFSIVQCNTDLGDNDLELTLAQGINYNVPNPKEVDTYIRFEFPWPTEEPYRDKTATIYNTNNPVYNEKFTLPIQRNVRACQRVFKRQAIKCEVWSKGGFFRGDSLIGTAVVKLQPLESKCTVHESFDLMDGRKTVGGKLEVKVRLRNPILTKQVERVEEKWLVLDH